MKFDISLETDFELKIGPHSYSIKFVDRQHPELNDPTSSYGVCIIETREILIQKGIPYSLKLSTLMHEVMHVFEDLYSLKISHKDLNFTADMLTCILWDNFRED